MRPRRAAELASGLVINSPTGDARVAKPATLFAGELRAPFDLILVSNKAYDLDGAVASFAPAVGPNTAILPLLNGMRHLDVLDERGATVPDRLAVERVLLSGAPVNADILLRVVEHDEGVRLRHGERPDLLLRGATRRDDGDRPGLEADLNRGDVGHRRVHAGAYRREAAIRRR